MDSKETDAMAARGNADSTENQVSDSGLTLTKPHLSPTRGGPQSAKQTILFAIESLEEENDELRKVNNRMLAEMEHLRAENDQLRKELDNALQEKEDGISQINDLQEDNHILQDKIRIQTQHFSDENRKFYTLESNLKQDNEKFRKQFENLKTEFSKKENEIRGLVRELDIMRTKLEKANNKKNHPDKDVEVFHEMEMLKNERKTLLSERDELQKLNKKLNNEIKKLESSLEEKLSELRNENRRHSLLTKEFNSLLEENSHLKLQLRRRQGAGSGHSVISSKDDMADDVTVTEITHIGNSRRFHSSTNIAHDSTTSSPTAESTTSSIPRIPRERTLLSRDKMRGTKEKTIVRNESYPSALTQNAVRQKEQEFLQERRPIPRKSIGSRSDSDSSPPPDVLPNISGGRTWRP